MNRSRKRTSNRFSRRGFAGSAFGASGRWVSSLGASRCGGSTRGASALCASCFTGWYLCAAGFASGFTSVMSGLMSGALGPRLYDDVVDHFRRRPGIGGDQVLADLGQGLEHGGLGFR